MSSFWSKAIEAAKAKHGLANGEHIATGEATEPDGTPFVFYEACWETLSDAKFNATIAEPKNVVAANQAMVESITGGFRPLLRPNAEYLVEFTTNDKVAEKADAYQRQYAVAFRTKGPIGHFHEFEDAGKTVEHPKWADNPNDFALDRLAPYIDFQRSYPAPDGNLVGAKPLYYEDRDVRLFFTEPYVERFFTDWAELSPDLPTIESSLRLDIIDPSIKPPAPLPPQAQMAVVTGVIDGPIVGPVVFRTDPDPVVPAALAMVANMVNHGPKCSGDIGVDAVPASFGSASPEGLRPEALYTATWSSSLNGRSAPVHSYPFQTSRYASHASHVHSYAAHGAKDPILAGQPRVFALEPDVAPLAAEIAAVVNGNPPAAIQSMYATQYDQLLDGVLKLNGLPAPVGTEFTAIGNDEVVQALLIRSPEPFNDPRLPNDTLKRTITAPGLVTIVAPDTGRAILVRPDGAPLFGGPLELTFEQWQFSSDALAVVATETVTVTLPGVPPPSMPVGMTLMELVVLQDPTGSPGGPDGTSGMPSDGGTSGQTTPTATHFCPEHCDDSAELSTSLEAAESTAARQHPVNGLVKMPCLHFKWGKRQHGEHWVETDNTILRNASDVHVWANGRASSDPDWVRALLPDRLKPTAGNFKNNVYFVNGISKDWSGAHGQAQYINKFLGPSYNVRIIHNKTALKVAGDNIELGYDYSWTESDPFKSLCTQSIFSLLHHGFDAQADIGLIGSSGGTLKTYIAVRAFASLGTAQAQYLKDRVQLLHLGCLVHRQFYPWLEANLKHYQKHIDRRDPFARTFSGEVIPVKALDPVNNEGPIVSHAVMASVNPAISSLAIGVAAGLFGDQGVYHAIRNNYMADPLRHCRPETVFLDVPVTPEPVVSRIRVRFKTGTNGTTDPIRVTVAGVSFDAVDPTDGKLNGGAVNWFYEPTGAVPLSSINQIALYKKGKDDWRLRGLTVQADTDQGLRTLYENDSLGAVFGEGFVQVFYF